MTGGSCTSASSSSEKRLGEWRDGRGVGHVKNEEGCAPSIKGGEVSRLRLPPLGSLLHYLGQRSISDAFVACFDWDRNSRASLAYCLLDKSRDHDDYYGKRRRRQSGDASPSQRSGLARPTLRPIHMGTHRRPGRTLPIPGDWQVQAAIQFQIPGDLRSAISVNRSALEISDCRCGGRHCDNLA